MKRIRLFYLSGNCGFYNFIAKEIVVMANMYITLNSRGSNIVNGMLSVHQQNTSYEYFSQCFVGVGVFLWFS